MRRWLPLLVLATALATASCADKRAALPHRSHLEALREAFAARSSEPLRAAELFERAGAGSLLEEARLETWTACLERGRGGSEAWQLLLGSGLPPDLRLRALEGLGAARLAAGDPSGATAVLEEAARGGRRSADERLLGVGDEAARRRAAVRLAIAAPGRLRRLAPELEPEAVRALGQADWLERARSWRREGAPERAVAELRSLRWVGEPDRRRHLELARAELAAGRASRALSTLPGAAASSAEELVVRAEASRRRAWSRYPAPAAQPLFSSCLEAARRGVATAQGEDRCDALRLLVECATEAGRLDEALDGWWRLSAVDREGSRREWLGRRLGLALAARPATRGSALDLAESLPESRRCLRYWVGTLEGGEAGRRELSRLADVPFGDLYAIWARDQLGLAPPAEVRARPAVGGGPAPRSVALLLDWGAPDEAVAEWRRLRSRRALSPAEAVAAALTEQGQGHRNEAVACLRAAIPELGRVDMDRAPEDALRGYLPLAWPEELLGAARTAGLEPSLLAAVVRQESLFSPLAVSPRGARGLLQLLPGTARPHALALGLGPQPDLLDAGVNLRLGARELARLLARFGAVEPALAAYNAGEGRAATWWARCPERRRFTESIPFPETYTYVRRVSYLAEAYRLAYGPQWRGR